MLGSCSDPPGSKSSRDTRADIEGANIEHVLLLAKIHANARGGAAWIRSLIAIHHNEDGPGLGVRAFPGCRRNDG